MEKLILLDIDNTLFDSLCYRKKLFEAIAKKITPEKSQEEIEALCQTIYEGHIATTGLFDFKEFTKEFSKKLQRVVKEEDIASLVFDTQILKGCMYPEVKDVLLRMTKVGTVGIVSQGQESMQRAKIKIIEKLLHPDKIYIKANKKEAIDTILKENKDYKIIFIDDWLSLLHHVKQTAKQTIVIWSKRGRHAHGQLPIAGFEPDKIITSLDQALPFIEEI